MKIQKRTIATGIVQDPYGFEARVRVGSGDRELVTPPKRFPPPNDNCTLAQRVAEIQVWQARERLKLRDRQKRTGGAIVRDTLSADKIAYLKKAELTPKNHGDRARHLDWWIQTLPNRSRHSLEADEIRQALKGLRTNTRPSRPASASLKNDYRMALSHLYTVLDGKAGRNPVRDVPQFDEPEPLARDQSYELIDLILAHIRDRGLEKDSVGVTKLRLRVLAYCPVTPAQLRRMTRQSAHIDPVRSEMTTPGRDKGAGTVSKRKHLSPDALAAIQAYDAANLWQRKGWSRSSLIRTFRRGLTKAIEQLRDSRPDLVITAATMRPYDFRHSFGSFVFDTTEGDLATTQEVLDHADPRTTKRYLKGALARHVAAVGVKVAAAMAQRPKAPAAALLRTTTAHRPKTSENIQQNANVSEGQCAVEKAGRKRRSA